ncbi:MAG: aspartate/glutamate racemase family protein [Alphaproteobacteria bacterium]|nr:aspartate/glutamate racemase family protein [Alphaproteobacteria bacterium]HPF47604.1 aspartate/glutamate racemase family protein [Emcibacteraceae bacterium]
MKTIGLLGGLSWESTVVYYREINRLVGKSLGGYHSAKIILNSLEFAELEDMMQKGSWPEIQRILIEGARVIEDAGADFLLICSNTMHRNEMVIRENIDIPVLHIADATAEVLIRDGISKVGLLGTTFTMEQDYYKGRLKEKFGLDVIVPPKSERERVHAIIDEICMGETNEKSKADYQRIIRNMAKRGAEAVILGCTEIGILIKDGEADVPLYDTAIIHSQAAVKMAIE